MAQRRIGRIVRLSWDDLDQDGHLDHDHRAIVDTCVRVIHDAARGPDRLIVLDYIAAIILYEAFGMQPGEVETAAATHGNHIMALADILDEASNGQA